MGLRVRSQHAAQPCTLARSRHNHVSNTHVGAHGAPLVATDFTRLRDIAPGGEAAHSFVVGTPQLLLATASGDLDSVPGTYEIRVENGAGACPHNKKAVKFYGWGFFCGFVRRSGTTRTEGSHGGASYVRRAKRNRIDTHWGEIERLAVQGRSSPRRSKSRAPSGRWSRSQRCQTPRAGTRCFSTGWRSNPK